MAMLSAGTVSVNRLTRSNWRAVRGVMPVNRLAPVMTAISP
jgi:hypothetical protein